MKYLVLIEGIDWSPTTPPAEVADVLEYKVIPSVETLAKWEEEGKVTGGNFAGRRASGFILEAESNEELDKLLASLPFWGNTKNEVIPLYSFSARIDMLKQLVERLKA